MGEGRKRSWPQSGSAELASVLRSSIVKSMVPPPIPTPDTLKGVDDLIRSGFEAYRESCFNWLLVATGLVVVGLLFEAFELVPDIVLIIRRKRRERRLGIKLLNSDIPEWAKTVAFVGWFLIVAGVGGEFVADSFVSKADGFVQKFDEILLAETTKNAGDARLNAQGAATAARLARQQSDQAVSSASNASTIARGARREADSFERDIVSAKNLAASAESHLADALKQAADATAELNRLKSPRSLTNASVLVSALEQFRGTEYTFTGVFADDESTNLLKEIDSALQLAGWKRVKSPSSADIVVNIEKDFQVSENLHTGVFVEVQSSEKLESLQARPVPLLPQYIRAGIALKQGLASAISPTQETLKAALAVNSGTSTLVYVLVGKKP